MLGSTVKRVAPFLAVMAVAAVAFVGIHLSRELNPRYATPRREWKDHAIQQINQRLADSAWLTAQTAHFKSVATTRRTRMDTWIGDEFLWMKNGDWIVCQNVCQKQAGHIPDLFIGRASDGKWYYSTFHFCVGKCTLYEANQPNSLAQFAAAYWLTPFDGKSDDSLNITWDPGRPYGDEIIQSMSPPLTDAATQPPADK